MHHDELNSDEVMALLASLESAGGNDRRRHPRSAAPQHVTAVLRRTGSAPVHAAVRDLSRSGVGIFSPVPLDPNDQLDVLINPRGKPMHAACRVASCRLNADGRYAIGLEFIQINRHDTPPAPPTSNHANAVTAPTPATPQPSPSSDPDADNVDHVESVAARLAAALAD